jgi:ribosome-binding ATPase
VPHPLGQVDPLRDIELINTELYLADLETVDRQISKSSKLAKGGGRGEQEQLALLEELRIPGERAAPHRGPAGTGRPAD